MTRQRLVMTICLTFTRFACICFSYSLSLCVSGCELDPRFTKGPVTFDIAIGNYGANVDDGFDSLILYADSSYAHFGTSQENGDFSTTERWKLSGESLRGNIHLYGFRRLHPELRNFAYGKEKVTTFAPIRLYGRGIEILISGENDNYYLKSLSNQEIDSVVTKLRYDARKK